MWFGDEVLYYLSNHHSRLLERAKALAYSLARRGEGHYIDIGPKNEKDHLRWFEGFMTD